MEANIIAIGNSKGVRLPAPYLKKLATERVHIEQMEDGTIQIKPVKKIIPRSEWAAMLAGMECKTEPELADWDQTLSDGIS